MAKVIHTDKAPLAIGPYSQAIESNGFVFCSGQLGIDPKSNELKHGVEDQTSQALQNLQAVLHKAGLTKEAVVKTTIYLKNMDDFKTVNEIYATFFGEHKPARVTVEVARLPKDGLVEIETVAVKSLPAGRQG